MERARLNPLSSVVLGGEEPHAELDRVGFRRRRQLVDERFGGEGHLWTVGIPQVSGAKRRLPHERQAHDLGDVRRFGMAYMSEGVAALPGAGVARRVPMS